MCASYDISNMVCCECDKRRTLVNFINDQHLRDMRHRTLCMDLNGEIGECSICKTRCTTSNIIRIDLDRKRRSLDPSSYLHYDNMTTTSENRLAVYAMTRISKGLQSDEEILLFEISRYVYNEHSYKHRPTCFKKGCECRFFYPSEINSTFKYEFEHLDHDSNQNFLLNNWITFDGAKRAR